MTNYFEKFIERQRELVGKATPKKWQNMFLRFPDTWPDGKHRMTVAAQGPNHKVEETDLVVADMDFIANARNIAEIQLEMLQVMSQTIRQISDYKNPFDDQFRTCAEDLCNIAIDKIQQLAEKALEAP